MSKTPIQWHTANDGQVPETVAGDHVYFSQTGVHVNDTNGVMKKVAGNYDEQIKALNGVKFYTALTQINSSFTLTTSIADIYSAMPSNSILMYTVSNDSTTTVYPNGYGVCEIKKTNINRDSITFHDSSTNTLYTGSCHANFSGIFSGWVKLATATEIAALETRIVDLENAISTSSLSLDD